MVRAKNIMLNHNRV